MKKKKTIIKIPNLDSFAFDEVLKQVEIRMERSSTKEYKDKDNLKEEKSNGKDKDLNSVRGPEEY